MTAWQVSAVTATGGTMTFGVTTPTRNAGDARDAASEVLGSLPLRDDDPLTVTPLPDPLQRTGWNIRYADGD